ncbi:MAG: hypothetical protein ACLSVD_06535 [Eggerthellaceae bacterium]
MILILLVAARLSALRERAEAGIIFRHRDGERGHRHRAGAQAQSSLEALRSMSAPRRASSATAWRWWCPRAISCRATSCSWATAAWRPADLRLVEAGQLRMQAALTGESVPVEKGASRGSARRRRLTGRMAFRTAIVTAGRGAASVATGMGTEVGHIGMLEGDEELDTPIKREAGLVRQDPHHRGRGGGAGRAGRPGLRPPVSPLLLLACRWPSR